METVLQNIIIIIYGLFGLGIIILVHEFGHFIMAKKFGVRVEVFSIGFGRGVLKFRKGDTVYQIGYIPMGGYCKLAGEEPVKFRPPAQYEFYSKSSLQRLGIVFAGPFMNYLLGIILFAILFFIGVTHHTYENKIIVLDKIFINGKEVASPAKMAGLKDNDILLKIDGKNVRNWYQIRQEIITAGDNNFKEITVKRKNKILKFKIKPIVMPETGGSVIGIIPWVSNEIELVATNTPAFKAGLKPGDKIIQINNKRISNFKDAKLIIAQNPDKYIKIKVLRNRKILNFRIKPKNINGGGVLGVVFKSKNVEYINKSKNIFKGIYNGFFRANRVIKDVLYSLRVIFTGRVIKRKAVSGPVKIVYATGEAAKKGGIAYFFYIIGFVSIAVAFFNLLPIPAVDGSYILIFLIEFIIRRQISYKVIKILQKVGLVLIAILAVIIIINDIRSFVEPKSIPKNPFIPIMS